MLVWKEEPAPKPLGAGSLLCPRRHKPFKLTLVFTLEVKAFLHHVIGY